MVVDVTVIELVLDDVRLLAVTFMAAVPGFKNLNPEAAKLATPLVKDAGALVGFKLEGVVATVKPKLKPVSVLLLASLALNWGCVPKATLAIAAADGCGSSTVICDATTATLLVLAGELTVCAAAMVLPPPPAVMPAVLTVKSNCKPSMVVGNGTPNPVLSAMVNV